MKCYKYVLFFVFSLIHVCAAQAQKLSAISLWPNGAPGANPEGCEEIVRIYEPTGDHLISNVHNPSVIPTGDQAGKKPGVRMEYRSG